MDVLTATTGREAISILKADRGISIVRMEMTMREMDGYETIQAIRRISARRLPIIALTAKQRRATVRDVLRRALRHYLAKPVNTEQLLSALRIGYCRAWGRRCLAIAIR